MQAKQQIFLEFSNARITPTWSGSVKKSQKNQYKPANTTEFYWEIKQLMGGWRQNNRFQNNQLSFIRNKWRRDSHF